MRYFSIHGKQSGKVLDASMSNIGEVVLWEFNGQDNQFWFWDGEMLRNKKFPNKVLDFHWSDYQKNSWGKVYLHNENGGMNQRWIQRGDEIFCQYGKHQNLRLLLDVHSSSTQNGAKVGCYSSTGGVNQKWIIRPKENSDDDFVIVDRPGKYFIIQQLRCGNSGKVMNASLSKIGEITMSDFNGGENQLWYWDGRHQDILRNKKFPDKVLDFHWMDYKKWSFGKVYLFNFNDGYNQKWKIEGNQIICKGFQTSMQSDLRLEGDFMKVGVKKQNGCPDQKWTVKEVNPRSRKTSGEKLAAGIGILAGGIIGGLISGLGNSSPGNVTKPKPKQNAAGTHSISVSVNPAQSTGTARPQMAPQTASNVYHSGIGPLHPHYYPQPGYPPQTPTNYPGYPPQSPPNYPGYPPQSPPNYPGYPPQSPPNYPGYPPQSPPNYPGYPPQSPPNYPGYPPQSPPNFGPYGAASMPPPFNPLIPGFHPAASMQPPFNPGCPPAYSPYPTPPNYPGGQPNNGNTQPGQPQNPPHY